MADLFTNTTFYADADPTTGFRTPVALLFEDPENPDDTGGGVDNPDPGGPGGGTGGGGDIGNVDGSGVSTIGPAPTLTRKTHDQDIFVVSGGSMSITYVASDNCTILPKRPRANMTLSYTDDGREMTISWIVPAGEVGDSTYIGAEAHVYGGDNVEAISTIWDRLHINKVSGDIKVIGLGTSYPILQTGIERADINAGDTVIINNNTDESPAYSDFFDVINVGYWGGTDGNATNTITPNGVSSGVTTVNVIGSDGFTVTGTEDIVNVTKSTTIMAATPLGVILDRQDRTKGVSLYGGYRGGQGSRDLHGVKVKGIALRNWVDSFSIRHADECAFEFCSAVSDTNPADFESATGDIWGDGYGSEWNDGGAFSMTSARNCYFDATHSIGNSRFGAIAAQGTGSDSKSSKHNAFRRMIHTPACLYPNRESICQSFTYYGCRSHDTANCFSVDSAFFKDGFRNSYLLNESLERIEHCSFIATNNSGDDIYSEGLISLNMTMGGYRNKTDSGVKIVSEVVNSVFWDKKGTFNTRPLIEGDWTNYTNCTIGKNESVYFQNQSCIEDYRFSFMTNMLMIHGSWDYDYSSSDQSIGGYPHGGTDVNFCIIPPENTNATYAAQVVSFTDFTLIESENTKSSGAQYIGYTRPNSTLRSLDLGCPDVFATVGTGGHLQLDADRTRFDGIGADQMVNWLSEVPWLEFRRERQAYSCVANSQTFTGNVGIGKNGVNPTDYINRFGTTPSYPQNAPMISDIYAKALGTGAVTVWWRPVCPAYRSTITGYHVYVDGIKITPEGTQLDKETTSIQLTLINTGSRTFQVVVVDPVNGNSGLSRPEIVMVT